MKHRPKRRMFTGSVLLLAAILAAAASGAFGQRPFRALDAADLAAADIWLGPPDVARSLSREEITALTELLQHVRIT